MSYTAKQKATAVRLLEAEGIGAAVASCSAHRSTVYRWFADSVARQSPEKQRERVEGQEVRQAILAGHIRARLIETAAAHLDRSDEATTALDAVRWATAFGILLDKLAGHRAALPMLTEPETEPMTSEQEAQIDRELRRIVEEMEHSIRVSYEMGLPDPRTASHDPEAHRQAVVDWIARDKDKDNGARK